MKKIFNWTFGSIFRTFGRIIAYLSVGLLIASILSKTGFKLTDLLPIMRVNAAEITTNVSYARSGVINVPYEQKFDNSWIYKDFTSTTTSTRQEFKIDFTDILNTNDVDFIELTMFTSEPTTTELTSNNIGRYCTKYSSEFAGYAEGNIPTYDYTCQSFREYTTGETTTVIDNDYKLSNFNIYVITTDDQYLSCTITSTGKIQCPTNRKNLKSVVTHFIFKSNHITHMRYAINIDYNLYIDSNSKVQSSVDNIKDSTNDIKDSINNDNVDDSTNTASNFFNNFSTDTHGLTGIITAPLNAIQSLTSKTCSPLVLPLPFVDKDLTLPCMREIYVDNFGAFMNIYDVITLGIISYWIMVRIFALVKDFKNPDHDEIEVMDL